MEREGIDWLPIGRLFLLFSFSSDSWKKIETLTFNICKGKNNMAYKFKIKLYCSLKWHWKCGPVINYL